MEVNSLLSHEPVSQRLNGISLPHNSHHSPQHRYHQYPTRQSSSIVTSIAQKVGEDYHTPPPNAAGAGFVSTPNSYNRSPQNDSNPKHVAFELLFPDSPHCRARLPMRVQIFPHDTTESIITTVKNFYGLYEGGAGSRGISFEDERGNTLIARYENFQNNMVIYVRVLVEHGHSPRLHGPPSYPSGSPDELAGRGFYQGEHYVTLSQQPAQALTYGQPLSRPASRMRVARDRSASPMPGRGRRSISVSGNHDQGKPSRLRAGLKSRGSSVHGSAADLHTDAMNGFSDSDGGHGSVTSSKKAKSEQLASAEISLDNIVEGGRRKRAKFESSVSDEPSADERSFPASYWPY